MQDANAPWQLVQAGSRARLWLVGITTALPVVVSGIALGVASMQGDDLGLVEGNAPLSILLVLVGVAALGGAIALVISRAMRRHAITMDQDGIEVATTFYKRRVPWSALRLDEARVVDLDEHTAMKPSLKTNGTAIPGFRSGWFRMRNRDKAFVAMAAGPRVAWVPTTLGYGLMLQPRHPQALLEHLRDGRPVG